VIYQRATSTVDPEERRPGITALIERIERANPKWSQDRVLAEAKMRYTNRKIVVVRKGKTVEIDNPDYMGGTARKGD
jgi:hypothetical protein